MEPRAVELIDKVRIINSILNELRVAEAIGEKGEYEYWERVMLLIRGFPVEYRGFVSEIPLEEEQT